MPAGFPISVSNEASFFVFLFFFARDPRLIVDRRGETKLVTNDAAAPPDVSSFRGHIVSDLEARAKPSASEVANYRQEAPRRASAALSTLAPGSR